MENYAKNGMIRALVASDGEWSLACLTMINRLQNKKKKAFK